MRLPRVFALLTLYVATPTLGADQVPLADHTGLADERNNGETVPLPSDNGTIRKVQTSPKKLHGRFIHITDIHPDPYYVNHGTVATSCHRKRPKKDPVRGSFWGAPNEEDCDSPPSLVNLTFAWLEKEWADKVDFVIWTGDSARHDNDRELPRTLKEIFELNRQTTAPMERIFTKRGIPVIPNMGNNDVFPHHIMFPGPNEITKEFEDIWKSFIPFPSYQIFQRGAYFSVEVVPNKLAAISINTLYFFDSNKAVEGCREGTEDPGTLQLDWLEVQLNLFRSRGMQVWMTGHVTPTLGLYYEDCYLGYARLALRFQDTIVGHLFGHQNTDYFFWIDPHELFNPPSKSFRSSRIYGNPSNDRRPIYTDGKKRVSLAQTLLEDFKSLPPEKKPPPGQGHKINYDDYAIVNVAPSVVPVHAASVRIFTYNITDWNKRPAEDEEEAEDGEEEEDSLVEDDDEDDDDEDDDDDELIPPGNGKKKKKKGSKRRHGHRHDTPPGSIDCTKPKNRQKEECVFKKPRHASKDSPSRRNKLWTPLGYTQFYIPEMEEKNKTHPPTYEVEYMTYPLEALSPPSDWPVPQHLLPPSLRNLTQIAAGFTSEYTPWSMKDLTIKNYIRLARKIARKPKMFKKFKSLMYSGGEEP